MSMESGYYETSRSGRYVLRRDGVEVMRGSETEVWKYLHRVHSFSVHHAITYEGYSILPQEKVA